MMEMHIQARGYYRLTVVDRETGLIVSQEPVSNAISLDGKEQILRNLVDNQQAMGFGPANTRLTLNRTTGGPKVLAGMAEHEEDRVFAEYPHIEAGTGAVVRRIYWRFVDITAEEYTVTSVSFGRQNSPVFSTADVAWGTKSSRYNWLIDYILEFSGGPIGNSPFANIGGAHSPPSNNTWNSAFQGVALAFVNGTPILGGQTMLQVEGTVSGSTGVTDIGLYTGAGAPPVNPVISGFEATFVFRAGDGIAPHTWNRARIYTTAPDISGLFWHDNTDHGAKDSGSVWTYTWKLTVN
jgi:hypothetical protein